MKHMSTEREKAASISPVISSPQLPQKYMPTELGLVRVQLRSGQPVVGQLDIRTSSHQLWLRRGSETLNIVWPIPWQEVAEIRLDGQPVPVGFLREFLDLLLAEAHAAGGSPAQGAAGPARKLSETQIQLLPPSLRKFVEAVQATSTPGPKSAGRIVLEGKDDKEDQASDTNPGPATSSISLNHAGRSQTSTDGARQAASGGGRVAYLGLDAWLGQWDADLEPDGLVVEITPADAAGRPVPVHGMLEVTLVIPPRGLTAAVDQKAHRQRWVQRVRPEDFSPVTGSAQYRLPFGSLQNNPEWNLDLAGHGAVTAHLSVPGQGSFSAATGCVRVRTFSPVRDQLQQSTGKRFFPWESPQP